MMNHIDAFTFVKLSTDIKKKIVESATRAKLVDQPNVLLVFNRILKHSDRRLLFWVGIMSDNLVNL